MPRWPANRARTRRTEEADLHRDVVRFLRAALPPDWRFFHPPNGGKRDPREAARFVAMGVSPGVPDLIVLGPDRAVVAVELKAAKGRETPAQIGWLDHFVACGWRADACRSVAEVEALLSMAGVPLKARIAA